MRTQRNVLILLILVGMHIPASAQDSPGNMSGPVGCHLLMTQKECGAMQTTLARLGEGEARQAFLDTHFALMREREAACDCSRLHVASRRSTTATENRTTRHF
jgi:hypothetical protein